MTAASLKIEHWGEEYVVIGELNGLTVLSPLKFKTFLEALKEVQRIVGREVLRYESGMRGSSSR